MVDRITVYQREIELAFWPGGSVYQNVRRLAFDNLVVAQNFAPVRTGAMQQSIGFTITPAGKNQLRYTMVIQVPYAPYVLGGTTGPIFPSKGFFLWVRPSPHSWYFHRTPRMKVDGQDANNFLFRSVVQAFDDQGLDPYGGI